ncbi:MAG: glycosyltransferase family 9 protein [Endomicrobium sp.]|jgi:heptosyltransferase-2|nr:glycosyltransferase family 9 protein [Endomicrobium sp.]
MNKKYEVFTDCINFPLDRPCVYQKENARVCPLCKNYKKVSSLDAAVKILIIKLGAMGDVLRTTFILCGLKEIYPKSRISWIVSKNNAAVLRDNNLIDEIIVADEKINEFLTLNYFDAVINLDLAPESLALAKLANAERVLGYVLDNKRNVVSSNDYAAKWLKMSAYDALKKENKFTYQHWMSKIANLSRDDYEIIVPLNEVSVKKADGFLKKNKISSDKKIIGINPGAGKRWKMKKWRSDGFAAVAKYFSDKSCAILLLGGKDDEEEINALIKENIPNVFSTGTDNCIADFFAFINLCDIILCGDTMALHAAAGLKKKIVALFGPTSISEIETYNRTIKLQASINCICCYKQDCGVKENCMKLLTDEEVIRAVERQLKTLN